MTNLPTKRSITDFRSTLSGGGARPNIFEVRVNLPPIFQSPGIGASVGGFANSFTFLCKAAALPASNISPIEVPFRGRTLKVAGDRTFDTWTVTVINDSDFLVRNHFETWMGAIGQHTWHTGLANPAEYQSNADVYQLGRQPPGVTANSVLGLSTGGGSETVLAHYTFNGIFPTNVGQIDLSYDSTDQIEEFTVEFQVQWWSHHGVPMAFN